MKGFPVNVGQLSSFRTSAQNKKTIEGLKNGTIDVVIGTHRVLSRMCSLRIWDCLLLMRNSVLVLHIKKD